MIILIVLHFVFGFIYSALMAGYFEQDSLDDIYWNFVLWEVVIFVRTLVVLWRLLAGKRPDWYKKPYYIYTRW
jgi:hypothetical protein